MSHSLLEESLDDEYYEFKQEIEEFRMKRHSTEFSKIGGIREQLSEGTELSEVRRRKMIEYNTALADFKLELQEQNSKKKDRILLDFIIIFTTFFIC